MRQAFDSFSIDCRVPLFNRVPLLKVRRDQVRYYWSLPLVVQPGNPLGNPEECADEEPMVLSLLSTLLLFFGYPLKSSMSVHYVYSTGQPKFALFLLNPCSDLYELRFNDRNLMKIFETAEHWNYSLKMPSLAFRKWTFSHRTEQNRVGLNNDILNLNSSWGLPVLHKYD